MSYSSQSKCLAAATVLSALAFIFNVGFGGIVNIPGVSPFNQTIGSVSSKYTTAITPTGATFSIWGLIYAWQGVLALYSFTLLCRKVENTPLYVDLGFIPLSFFLPYSLNSIGNAVWTGVWVTEHLEAAMAVLAACMLSLLVSLAAAVYRLDKTAAEMIKKGLKIDIWATRLIVHNGTALYLGWVSCATVINVVTVAHYKFGVTMDKSCYVAIPTLMAIIGLWFVIETLFADRQLRYVFAQYIAYVAAATGAYIRNNTPDNPNAQLLKYLLIVAVSIFGLKLIIMVLRTIIQGPTSYKKASEDNMKLSQLSQ